MSILVLGGDGYLGWPLAIKLALRHTDSKVVMVDNYARRAYVKEVGGESLTPLPSTQERLASFKRIFAQDNLSFVEMDIAQGGLDELLKSLKPTHIYHLAQQASAPYSMSTVERAVHTIQNNEVGNMRLLWAIRRQVPEAHLIKLGSFGEYAKCGLDIAEGYFQPSYGGKTAERPTPYPRESDDIYHITKINDTNFISMACRKWNLRVTDVMQATIFGVHTEETAGYPELYTRFDYDGLFGTVTNRFLTQTVAGQPMTIYGTGMQRTGLMGLDDSLNSLAAMATDAPNAGTHRVINHVTEANWCINEIAETISDIAKEHGYSAGICRDFDPRCEQDQVKLDYQIRLGYVQEHLRPTPFGKVLANTFKIVEAYKERIDAKRFIPKVKW